MGVNLTQFSCLKSVLDNTTSGAVNYTLRGVTEFRVGYYEMLSPLEVVCPYYIY